MIQIKCDLAEYLQKLPKVTVLTISAKTGENLQSLRDHVEALFTDGAPCDGSLLTNARQFGAITRASEAISRARHSLGLGITPDAVMYAKQMMTVLSVTAVGTCYQAACLAGLVKAGGDVSFVFKNDTIFVFLVVLPSAIIAQMLGAPAWVVFACLKCDQILKCFVAVVKINSFNWMKNLTRTNGEANA